MKFVWLAESYNKNSQFQYSHAIEALSHFDFVGTEKVLDVGCGDGKITAEIAEKVPRGHVIGIDSSSNMISFAKDSFEDRIKNLAFNLCRAEKINYHSEFNLITSFACLHWVKDQSSFLIGAKNALAPNGQMIITLYPKHPILWDTIEKIISHDKWKKYFVAYENPHISYDVTSYRSLCNNAGLKINHIKETTPVAEFNNKAEMEDFLFSWLPHTDQVTKENKRTLVSEIIESLPQENFYPEGSAFKIPFKKLDVWLTKDS